MMTSEPDQPAPRKARKPRRTPAHVAPPPPLRPPLADEPPLICRLEREVEEAFRPQMLAALEQKVADVASACRATRPACPGCGQPMPRKDARRITWLSRFGRVAARPARYRCGPCGQTRRPLLEALGVEPGRLCGALARGLALLGVVVPFELAARLAGLLLGVRVNAMTVWRCVQRLGEAAVRHDAALSAYHAGSGSEPTALAEPPATVVLGVDGCQLGMQVRRRRRRFQRPDERRVPLPPVDAERFREVKTGVLFQGHDRCAPSPGRRALVRRVLVTYLGDADGLFSRLWARLQELGWAGPHTLVVIVGDGAHWIWHRAAELFPQRCEILDFWHAVERAWEVARLHFGEGSSQGVRWAQQVAHDLRAGQVEAVIARLGTLCPTSSEARKKLDDLIGYYTENMARMRYDEYLRLGYGIGSGAVESAHKQVVRARLRQAGMRWSEIGAQRLLALRIRLLNGEWDHLDRLRLVPCAA
jgi:hypothetical protein